MQITAYSRTRFMESAAQWEVDREYFDPIFNYLVHGWEPGSFFSALLANDFFRAMQSSHPANSVVGLKKLCAWIQECAPPAAWGSHKIVQDWIKMSDSQHREHLEAAGLFYTEQEEITLALKGVVPAPEPYLW